MWALTSIYEKPFPLDSYGKNTMCNTGKYNIALYYMSHYLPPTQLFQNSKTIINPFKFTVFTFYSNDIVKSFFLNDF